MEQYTVYFNTSDFPGEYTVRRFTIDRQSVVADKELWARGKTLD